MMVTSAWCSAPPSKGSFRIQPSPSRTVWSPRLSMTSRVPISDDPAWKTRVEDIARCSPARSRSAVAKSCTSYTTGEPEVRVSVIAISLTMFCRALRWISTVIGSCSVTLVMSGLLADGEDEVEVLVAFGHHAGRDQQRGVIGFHQRRSLDPAARGEQRLVIDGDLRPSPLRGQVALPPSLQHLLRRTRV